tara:strand:+ start:973 stop:1461 length:489 start_codon:yes stop_codon:yes gene_type:complete
LLIGVTGDTHNNLKNISKICDIFNCLKVSLVIHTGDITLPKSLKAFSVLKVPMIGVFGNNDQYEKRELAKASKSFECKLYEEPYILKIKNKKIFVLHHPELIDEKMIDAANIIVHGHTHRFREERINNTLIFNPGECAGFLKGKNKIGLIDIEKEELKTISF